MSKKASPSSRLGKRQLRAILEGTRTRLFDSISRLTEEQMYRRMEAREPSIAEVLAHLAPVERAMRAEAEAIAREEKRIVILPSSDQERKWAQLAGQMVPPQMVNDLAGARWQTLRFLDSARSGELLKKGEWDGLILTAAGIIHLIALHEDEHVEQILRLRQEME